MNLFYIVLGIIILLIIVNEEKEIERLEQHHTIDEGGDKNVQTER
jgi:hypothetical protein